MNSVLSSLPSRILGLVVVLLLATGLAAEGQCSPETTVGAYTLTYVGFTPNGNGTSTWTYQLEWSGTLPGLDQLTIALCPQASVISSVPSADAIGYDGSTGIYGIKWEVSGGFPSGSPVTYQFTLAEEYAVQPIDFAARAGSFPNLGSICGPASDCSVSGPDPVFNLNCSLVDGCAGLASLSWVNAFAYDSIQILVDGTVFDTLSPPVTTYDLTLPFVGPQQISVVGIEGTAPSAPTFCTLDLPVTDPVSPTALSCQVDTVLCHHNLSWVNPSAYSSIEVYSDGALQVILPGDAESTTLTQLNADPHDICLIGETICGESFPIVCCTSSCTVLPPADITALECSTIDACVSDFQLSWTNGALDYDNIEIVVDGVLTATLPGLATSHQLSLPDPGLHGICAIPVRTGVSGGQACCQVESFDVQAVPPIGLTCEVVSAGTCEISLEWQNESVYGTLEVLVDGLPWVLLPGAVENANVTLPGPGNYSVALQGQTVCGDPITPVLCVVNCPGAPAEITGLTFDPADLCDCEFDLLWTNGSPDYEEIRLFLDGVQHQVIPGDFESLTVTLPTPEVHDIRLVPVSLQLPGAPSCVTVACTGTPAIPPSHLGCVIDPGGCTATLGWENESDYDVIRVLVDGNLETTLPGSAETVTLGTTLAGFHEFTLEGETVCGQPVTPVSCGADCSSAVTPGVSNLTCTLVDPCNRFAQFVWTNQGTYDQINVLLNGDLIAALTGSAESFLVELPAFGEYVVCIAASAVGISGAQACCPVLSPVTDPVSPIILNCSVNETSCAVDLSWQNSADYEELYVSIDGQLSRVLPGDTETTSIPLPSPGDSEVLIEGNTVCGVAFSPTTCMVTCSAGEFSDTQFIAGSMDAGGSIGTVIGALNEAAEVEFYYIDPTSNLQGFALALCFDCSLFGIDGSFSIEDSVTAQVGAEFIGQNVDNNSNDGDGCELVIGVLLDAEPPFLGQTLPPTTGPLKIGSYQFFVPEGLPCLGCFDVEFCSGVDGAGNVPIFNVAVIGNDSIDPGNLVSTQICVPQTSFFLRGDANNDGDTNVADMIFLLTWLFILGEGPDCLEAADIDDSGMINITDPVYLGLYLFQGGLAPPSPFQVCGIDPTPSAALDCMGPVMGCPPCN